MEKIKNKNKLGQVSDDTICFDSPQPPLSPQVTRSQICVKNLPKYAAEDRLREFFSQKGEVTDAKLMRTKDGKSRQFGFIGYRTEHEAEEALKYFNNSYFDTFRITCEIARKVGDPNVPRPWSRHSLKKQEKSTEEGKKVTGPKSLGLPNSKGEKKDSKNINDNNDPQLQEFLQVMQPRIKSKLWANDSLTAPPLEQKGKLERGDGKEESTLVQAELNERDDGSSDGEAAERPHNLSHAEVISDMDYFKSRVRKEWSDSESGDDENDNDEDDDDNDHGGNNSFQKSHGGHDVHKIDPKGQHDSLEGDASEEEVEKGSSQEFDDEMIELDNPSSSKDGKGNVLETARLFVRNLPYTATEDELEEHFSKYGRVSQVHLVIDRDTKRSKGIAYVLYALPESAARALEELDNSIFQGRLLHIMPAKQKSAPEKQEINFSVNQSSKKLKQQREEEKKKSEASGNTQAWNSLFMRPDTVVENIARKFGASKSDLLDREADDLAVHIALGETQVIAETKKALVNAGVNISSLEEYTAGKTEGVKRSNHVILVKNLPYGSSEGELAKMFGKFGSLDKIILPPTKTLALVVFLEPAEARAAFRGLAYKRCKYRTVPALELDRAVRGQFPIHPITDAPLYLEWAPGNILSQNSTSVGDANNSIVVGENDAKRVLLEQHVEGIADADIDTDRVEEGRILSVRVKKHLKNGKHVSMGFGFIELDSVETATNVCRDLQGTVLDGHALILQLCHAKKDEQVQKKVDRDQSSTKLIVRNVAFEATEKDLRQLFSPFGQIKSLRLPVRFGNHRGFGFVEYVTKQEAQNALQTLSNTHLYGRHLEGESLEELRARTAAQFTDEQNGFQNSGKLSKKRKPMTILDEGSVKFGRIAD
ncbi:uncharacterized protein LOC132276287 isoform X3 [Cornus florida]|uniref:uncharacterized protein LOC132276287 isoform X3 n=1 Tax=Cornus florida TaxID=4283 RepID=UPI002899D4DE|nr:uncharacterized protein LOC132276287 isoform X3 [Cornus florida]